MVNRNTKYWFFTLEANAAQRKLPSKEKLLDTFKDNFKNIGGLTVSKVFSKEAVLAYTSKQETRKSATVYCGRKEMFSTEIQGLLSKKCQTDVFDFLKMSNTIMIFRILPVFGNVQSIG